MKAETIINVATIAFIPIYRTVDLVENTKTTVAKKIDEMRCELINRRTFDKKHNYIRRSKR